MRAGSTLHWLRGQGRQQAAFRCSIALQISRISNNLGDARASSPITAFSSAAAKVSHQDIACSSPARSEIKTLA